MTKLKRCPFCGGRQTYRKHDGAVWLTRTNHKRDCIMREALSFVAFATEAEAIEAWNSRAERTCHDASLDSSTQFYCSECECTVDVPLLWGEINYCPNCGANVLRNTPKYSETTTKVVGE